MKRLIFFLFTLLSFSVAFAQPGSLSQSVYRSRVNDSTAAIAANVSAIAAGYAPIFFNAQASTPHWDMWNGSGYDHVFDFNSGTGGGGDGSLNTLAPNIQTGDYTIQAADTTKIIYMRHASTPRTATIPSGLKVGSIFIIVQDTTAAVTIACTGCDLVGTATLTPKEVSVWHHRETGKYVRLGGSTGTVSDWGDIGGTLSDQTDLQSALDAKVNDTGTETIAGVKTFSSDPLIPDEAYDATGWNGSLEPPTKNAVRDKIETLGAGTPAGSDTQVQFNNSSAFGGDSDFTFTGGNTLNVDFAIVDTEAYDATGWNSDMGVPTKDAVRDKIEGITPVDYTRQALVVSGSTTAMDFNSLTYRNFDITATQSANFSITFSNATNIVESRLTMRLTGTIVITMPSSVVMQNYETINGRWDTIGNNLTLIGTTATPFLLTFYSDGTNVICSASDPTE